MWKLNMAVCIAIGFGFFFWAMWKTINTENTKRK